MRDDKENSNEATDNYLEDVKDLEQRLQSVSRHCTSWTQSLKSTDQLEYRHGTVRTLGIPTIFWTIREREKMIEP